MDSPIKKLQSDVRPLRVREEIRPAGRYTAFSTTNVQNRWAIPEKCTVRPQEGPLALRMEMDRIRMESDLDSTFYHILNRIRIQIRIFSDMNTKQMPQIRILTRYMS